jgi:hypothetical protein
MMTGDFLACGIDYLKAVWFIAGMPPPYFRGSMLCALNHLSEMH